MSETPSTTTSSFMSIASLVFVMVVLVVAQFSVFVRQACKRWYAFSRAVGRDWTTSASDTVSDGKQLVGRCGTGGHSNAHPGGSPGCAVGRPEGCRWSS